MGIDTRYFGPSGWQLFHLIAFSSPNPQDVLGDMKDILPCKFCRASTAEFVKKHPIKKPYGRWLYDIHNMVNGKLRTQCSEDPAVINPGPDPEFEEVKARYEAMKPTSVPGRDFLMAIAYNFSDGADVQRKFLNDLAETYPFESLRKVFKAYMKEHEPELGNQKQYTKWMYSLMKEVSNAVDVPIRSYRGYMSHLAYYKSDCSRKTYRGKTCRRTASGRLTKNRDNAVTRRVAHRNLL